MDKIDRCSADTTSQDASSNLSSSVFSDLSLRSMSDEGRCTLVDPALYGFPDVLLSPMPMMHDVEPKKVRNGSDANKAGNYDVRKDYFRRFPPSAPFKNNH